MLPSKISNLVTGLQATSQKLAGEISGGGTYLKLAKTGQWVMGANEDEIHADSLWAINPMTLSTGFVCWVNNELEGEEMSFVTDVPVVKGNLPDVGGVWKPQIAMQLTCVDGEDKGLDVIYKASSVGGQKAFKMLLDEVLKRAANDETAIVPLVLLDVDHYRHKSYGKIFVPVITIEDWSDLDADTPPKAEVAKPTEPEPEPTTTRRRRRTAA